MPGGCSLNADFTSTSKDIIVDLKFERKKGFSWNPLNLLGVGGSKFNSKKDIHTNEKEELQKRVKDLEKRLCYITEKIDQCEGYKMDEEDSQPREEMDSEQESDQKRNNCKSNQNYMVVFKQPKLRRHARNKVTVERQNYFKEGKEKLKIVEDKKSSTENKTALWNNSTKMDSISIPWECKSTGWDKKTVAWENKAAAWEKVAANEGRGTAVDWNNKTTKWEDLSADWHIKQSDWDSKQLAGHGRSNAWEKKIDCKEKSIPWQNRIHTTEEKTNKKPTFTKGAFRQHSDQCVLHTETDNTVGDSKQWHAAPTGDQIKKCNRNKNDEPVTTKNLKSIIDEAVVETFGKTLQKYFKENLDGYIKKRVESALFMYKQEDKIKNSVSPLGKRLQKNIKSSTESLEDLRDSQSHDTIKEEEELDERDNTYPDEATTMNQCSGKITNSGTDNQISKAFLTRNKLSPKTNISWKCKYGEARSWANRKDSLKPVSAPSYIKDVLNCSPPAETKTLQLLKNHSVKPCPSDRNDQKKFFRQKISKES